jgi:hypothetical protein
VFSNALPPTKIKISKFAVENAVKKIELIVQKLLIRKLASAALPKSQSVLTSLKAITKK